MTQADLYQRVRQRPFKPFRLVVSEGATYEVRHPEQIMVASDSVVIGLPDESGDLIATTVLVDLIHVVRLEPIATNGKKAKAKKGNGA